MAIAEGKRRLIAASADFVRRVEQRLERDRNRLHDYYRALSREADWNSLFKSFEPLACSRRHRATFSATFTNETVEPLCNSCAEAT